MKICPQCHGEIADNAVFCTKCGAKVAVNTQSAQNVQDTQNTQNTQNTQSTQDTQNTQNTQNAQNGRYAGYTQSTQSTYGAQGAPNAQGAGRQGSAPYYQPADIYDHTAEFDPKDISENKVIAMIVYLLGTMGIIIALLASHTSAYAAFHVRQALKFTVINILLAIVTLLLCWTFIVPIAAGLMALVLLVVRFICFFSICHGQAKEPYIIRNFRFLR